MVLTNKEITERIRIIEKEINDLKYFFLDRIEQELQKLKAEIKNV
jgi:hypothetical protein